MGDAGDGFALLAAGHAHQRARGHKDDALEIALLEGGQKAGAQHRGAASAAAASGMRILPLAVVNHQAAIAMEALVQRHALLAHKLQQQITPHLPQIAGDDEVVVRGLSMGIRQQGQQSVRRCRGRCQYRAIFYASLALAKQSRLA